MELEDAYRDYRKGEIDQFLIDNIAPEEFDRLMQAKAGDRRKHFPKLSPETIRQIAEREVRAEIATRIPTLLSVEEFSRRQDAKAAETPPPTLA